MASLAERAGRRRSDIVRQQATRSVSGACRIWLNGSGVRSAVTPSARTLPRALLERLDKIHSGICVADCDFRIGGSRGLGGMCFIFSAKKIWSITSDTSVLFSYIFIYLLNIMRLFSDNPGPAPEDVAQGDFNECNRCSTIDDFLPPSTHI